ncbi:unnamed protein product [Hyaloperonospora brassicae]|uniref:RxLR effector candidate protein n=1 Tax=Hyaloperonospora brassicae TaxID=162125 RepID=A0AAV0TJV4_HYABA|nr:unnamed protein product [Hyaloperonospora brassicae]
MRPLNIAVYLVAVLHAMDVDPELAAAVGQRESISSRAAAVDSQVSGTHFVHPSESRLLRGEASASEQVRAGAGLPIKLKELDWEIVKFIQGRLRLNGDVDMGRIVQARAKPEHFVTAIDLPQNALKDRFDRMTFLEKLMYFFKLLFKVNVNKRLKLLRKFEEAYNRHKSKPRGFRPRGPIV